MNDNAIQAMKVTEQALGRTMSTLVVQECHLWPKLAEIWEALKAQISQVGLFGKIPEEGPSLPGEGYNLAPKPRSLEPPRLVPGCDQEEFRDLSPTLVNKRAWKGACLLLHYYCS